MENGDVPTATFISHFVMEEAFARDVSLVGASLRVFPQFGVSPNEAYPPKALRLLWMFYSLLVFPSEIWKRDDLLDVVIERAVLDRDLSPANRPIMEIASLRSMRNAVSHARLKIGDNRITFEDHRRNQLPHFQHTMTFKEATNFLLVLGRSFHKSEQVKQAIVKGGTKAT